MATQPIEAELGFTGLKNFQNCLRFSSHYGLILFHSDNPVNPDSDKKLAKILTYLALPRFLNALLSVKT
jgi:hypothetical protein